MSAPAAVRRTRSVREAADAIGVSRDVVYDLIKAGELPAKWAGNRYLIGVRALDAYITAIDEAADGVAT